MKRLTALAATKPVISVKFSVKDTRWSCQAGDAFSLLCENPLAVVNDLIELLGLKEDSVVKLTPLIPLTEDSLLALIGDRSITILELFTKYVDILHFPKKAFVRQLAEYCTEEADRRALLYLSSRLGSKDYMALASGHANILDFLHTFSSCQPPLDCLLSHLPLLHPRYFSVCSATGDECVEFIYSAMTYTMPDGEIRTGICTSWLNSCQMRIQNGEKIELSVYPRPSPHFRLPEDPSTPVIMICAGTGVSPFIGFLRTLQKNSVKRALNWLFYGFRNQQHDFLFEDELNALIKSRILSKLSIATSRETTHPKYVQDCLRLHSEEIYDLMNVNQPETCIYICGDELTMIKDVNTCIQEMLMEHGSMTDKEALALINKWNASKRIIRDIWV